MEGNLFNLFQNMHIVILPHYYDGLTGKLDDTTDLGMPLNQGGRAAVFQYIMSGTSRSVNLKGYGQSCCRSSLFCFSMLQNTSCVGNTCWWLVLLVILVED